MAAVPERPRRDSNRNRYRLTPFDQSLTDKQLAKTLRDSEEALAAAAPHRDHNYEARVVCESNEIMIPQLREVIGGRQVMTKSKTTKKVAKDTTSPKALIRAQKRLATYEYYLRNKGYTGRRGTAIAKQMESWRDHAKEETALIAGLRKKRDDAKAAKASIGTPAPSERRARQHRQDVARAEAIA